MVSPRPPTTPTDPGGGGGGSNAGQPTKVVCRFTLASPPREVPCSTKFGWWVQSRECYAKALSPQPPMSDPAWEGHTDGAIYECTRVISGPGPFTGVGIVVWFWSGITARVSVPRRTPKCWRGAPSR